MNILFNCSVANSYQFISIIAAKIKISEKYNSNVFLKIEYHQHWNRKNVSYKILEMIDAINYDGEKIKFDKEFNISINNPVLFKKNQIIIDDGVGAYRRNPFLLMSVIDNENAFKNGVKTSIFFKIKFLIKFFIKILISLCYKRNLSIFQKRTFKYFDVEHENKLYFIKSIDYICNFLSINYSLIYENVIVYLSQPYSLIGFQGEDEYMRFMISMIDFFKKNNENCILLIKKHPVDNFDYKKIDALLLDDDMPAEIYFYKNNKAIKKIVGFNSTSLLTGKILFDIPSFYIEWNNKLKLSGDCFLDKCFVKHLELLKI